MKNWKTENSQSVEYRFGMLNHKVQVQKVRGDDGTFGVLYIVDDNLLELSKLKWFNVEEDRDEYYNQSSSKEDVVYLGKDLLRQREEYYEHKADSDISRMKDEHNQDQY